MSEVSVKIDDTEKIDVIDNDVTDKDKIGVSDKDKIENYHNVTLNVDEFNQQICISDDKKLAYIDYINDSDCLKLCDKMNGGKITLVDFHKHRGIVALFCAFNPNDELILYNTVAQDVFVSLEKISEFPEMRSLFVQDSRIKL
ncbi:unnamed protein product [Rhizophagus irregularis]|nr:unnamed protein product [Rhizophagus irregularis]